MEFTCLDAIEFFQDGMQQVRVYYQTTEDDVIRESSYNPQHGWFVKGDGVVTTKAKQNSPITVTHWNIDNVTQASSFSTSMHARLIPKH